MESKEENKKVKVTFGLQPEHIELIESMIEKEGFTQEWLFERVAKQIGWLPQTVAMHYIKHLLKVRQANYTAQQVKEIIGKVLDEAAKQATLRTYTVGSMLDEHFEVDKQSILNIDINKYLK